MHFILKVLIAKYGKDIALKLYDEYKRNKASGSRGESRHKGFKID